MTSSQSCYTPRSRSSGQKIGRALSEMHNNLDWLRGGVDGAAGGINFAALLFDGPEQVLKRHPNPKWI